MAGGRATVVTISSHRSPPVWLLVLPPVKPPSFSPPCLTVYQETVLSVSGCTARTTEDRPPDHVRGCLYHNRMSDVMSDSVTFDLCYDWLSQWSGSQGIKHGAEVSRDKKKPPGSENSADKVGFCVCVAVFVDVDVQHGGTMRLEPLTGTHILSVSPFAVRGKTVPMIYIQRSTRKSSWLKIPFR
ncbi:hypothetical protein RRG08_011827 [Elysia crispata]|uniref:Uncharacterized protein n=1 Tax=Elysia crispata TaxID=231223 RepID=A0AAE1DJ01_9GAST|nr:hypothetical protein RRG08_011827 [Elysia crispata]